MLQRFHVNGIAKLIEIFIYRRATCIHLQNSDSPVLYLFWQWRQCGGTRAKAACSALFCQVIELSKDRRVVGVAQQAKKLLVRVCVWRFSTKWKAIDHLSSHFPFLLHLDSLAHRCESRTRKILLIKFAGAEIKRLTMLMQFVVNDMFLNNYLFKFSPRRSLWFLLFVNTYTPPRCKEILQAWVMV